MRNEAPFLRQFAKAFDPYTATSGTEAIAHLLYAMVRMTRPRTIIEYGPGYTTMFLLQALADNAAAEAAERVELLRKTTETGVLDAILKRPDDDRSPWSEMEKSAYRQWLYQDGVACTANPAHYLRAHPAHLHSFEALTADHPYPCKVSRTVHDLGLDAFFVAHYGRGFLRQAVPDEELPVDLAWNDCDEYRAFFEEYWSHLKSDGGLMVFHNATAWTPLYDDIQWMRHQRKTHCDLELIMLDEPHKLNQNGCAVLRRVSGRPAFAAERPNAVLNALRILSGAAKGIRA